MNESSSFQCQYFDTIERNGRVRAITFSFDNTKMAIGGDDRTATIYNVTSSLNKKNQIISLYKLDSAVTSLSFTPDSKNIVIGDNSGTVRICNASSSSSSSSSSTSTSTSTSERIWQEIQRDFAINAIAFSNHNPSDSERPILLAIADFNNTVAIYQYHVDHNRGDPWMVLNTTHPVSSIAFMHPIFTTILVVGGYDKKVSLYNLTGVNQDHKSPSASASASASLIQTFPQKNTINSIAISSKSILASAGNDKTIVIRNLSSNSNHEGNPELLPTTTFSHDSAVSSIAFASSPKTANDANILLAGDDGGHVIIRNALTGETLQSFKLDGSIHAVAYSPNGTMFAFGGATKQVPIYRVTSSVMWFNPIHNIRKLSLHYDANNGDVYSSHDSHISNMDRLKLSNHATSAEFTSILKQLGNNQTGEHYICICFRRTNDTYSVMNDTRATVFIDAKKQDTTTLSDAIQLIPITSGLFHMDPQTIQNNEYLLQVMVQNHFVLQAEQCSQLTIAELRKRFRLDSLFTLDIRFDPKRFLPNAKLPF